MLKRYLQDYKQRCIGISKQYYAVLLEHVLCFINALHKRTKHVKI